MFTLKQGECFGACGDAPVVLVNNKRMCSWMRPASSIALLAELAAERLRHERPGRIPRLRPRRHHHGRSQRPQLARWTTTSRAAATTR